MGINNARYKEVLDYNSKRFKMDSITAMDKRKIVERMKYFESFKKVFKVDLTKDFLDDIRQRIEGELENNVCIFIMGDKGSLKSSLAIELSRIFYPQIDVDKNIVYTNDDLRRRMNYSVEGEWFIRDETIRDFGVGSKQLEADIQMFVETLRKRRNCLIFICPNEVDIQGVDYVIHCFKGNFCSKDKVVMAGVIDVSGSKRYMGSIKMPLKWNDPLFLEYNKKKDNFLKMVSKSSVHVYNVKKDAETIIKIDGFENCKTKKERLLFVRENIAGRTIQYQNDVATKIEMIMRD